MPPPEHHVTVQAELGGCLPDTQSSLHAVLVVKELVLVVHPVEGRAREPGEGLCARLTPVALFTRSCHPPAAKLFVVPAVRAPARLLHLLSNQGTYLVLLGEAAYGLVQLMELVRAQALERVNKPLELATAHSASS